MEAGFYEFAVIFIGYFVLGVAGFGSALMIVPLLAFTWPISVVVPWVLLIDVLAAMLHSGLNFRKVIWRELPPLLPSVIFGAICGIYLIRITQGDWLLLVLGLYVFYIGCKGVKAAPVAVHMNASMRHGAGFTMGLVESMFGVAGPVVMSWLSQRLIDPLLIRATMPMTISALSCIALLMIGAAGGLDHMDIWRNFLVSIPFAFAGVWLGHQFAIRMQVKYINPMIYASLCVSGLVLCGKSLNGIFGV